MDDLEGTKNSNAEVSRADKRLGEYLRNKREQLGLTQSEVAHNLGYGSPQFISNIERGISNVPVKSLRTLIDLYKISASEVIHILLEDKRRAIMRQLGLSEESVSTETSNEQPKAPTEPDRGHDLGM